MANQVKRISVAPGTKPFDKAVFRLNWQINDRNVQILAYNKNSLQEIQKNVFVMPAYVDKDFNLFIVVSKFIENNWILAFSKAQLEGHNEVTDLSAPIPAGEGLNLLGKHSAKDANHLLRYFSTLVSTKRGEWCLLK